MAVSLVNDAGKQVMKVFAARNYDVYNPRLSKYIEVNVPEYLPTIPQDASFERIGLGGGYFVNANYPIVTGNAKLSHFLSLPLLTGSNCPIYFDKGTEFLLFTPTTKVEEGYLLYI